MDDDEFGFDLDLDLENPYHPYEPGVVGMGKTDNRLLHLYISSVVYRRVPDSSSSSLSSNSDDFGELS